MEKPIEKVEGYKVVGIDLENKSLIYKSDKELKKEVFIERMGYSMSIGTLKEFVESNPTAIVGGSMALFLQGIYLDRFNNANNDFDIVLPYFSIPNIKGVEIPMTSELPSGNDYRASYLAKGVKVDIRIDPMQRYKKVTYEGFEYKVTPLEYIIEAKSRYATERGGEKHKQDIYEMLTRKDINEY